MSDYLDANNEELLKDFFTEAEEQVEHLESNILVIEQDPTNHDAIDEIFRAAHTLKGGSATVEMNELSTFTHSVEDLLDALRSGTLTVSEPIVDVLLSAIDIIKAMLESRRNGDVYAEDVNPMVTKIKSFIPEKAPKKKSAAPKPAGMLGATAAPKPVQTAPKAAASSSPKLPITESELAEMREACQGGEKLWSVTVSFDESNPMNSVGGIQVFVALKSKGSVLKTIPDFDVLYEDEFQPKVIYFISSSASAEELEDTSFLDDVTLTTDAHIVDESCIGGGSELSAVEVPEEQAPVAETVSAPVTTTTAEPVAEAPAVAPEAQASAPAPTATKAPAPAKKAPVQQTSVLRVDAKRIDYLLNLVSETVITKGAFNQIATQMGDLQVQFQTLDAAYKEKVRRMFEQLPQYLEEIQNGASVKEIKTSVIEEFGGIISYFDQFEGSLKNLTTKYRSSTQNLGRIIGELQEGVMKIRMVPVNQIFSRFPRTVRDLCKSLNKKMDLIIEGEDTEMDKGVVEDLLDPIMHCVRNSADHGIESPEERKKAGKPETGTILLKAANEGNTVTIDIVDDGEGIDVERVKQKAVQKGLIHPDKVLSNQEAYNLIFLPGFSTNSTITAVSGRGVGLDVVKSNIEKLKGSVSVTSEKGVGSKFTIRLPLTLAIIQGLLVRVGKEVYSIPITNIIESVRVKQGEINTIDNYEVLNVRNEVISILRLSRLFNIKDAGKGEYNFIVIVGSQEKKIGIMVDSLIGEEDVVIKPLHDKFTSSPGIAGASILGDGSVSLIIDVSQLLELGVQQEITAQQERENHMLGK